MKGSDCHFTVVLSPDLHISLISASATISFRDECFRQFEPVIFGYPFHNSTRPVLILHVIQIIGQFSPSTFLNQQNQFLRKLFILFRLLLRFACRTPKPNFKQLLFLGKRLGKLAKLCGWIARVMFR